MESPAIPGRFSLIRAIDEKLHVLKRHLPYHESDHVLNIAYNSLTGGNCLGDIELRRNDETYMDALEAQRIPDPTTALDFTRRFAEQDVENTARNIQEESLPRTSDSHSKWAFRDIRTALPSIFGLLFAPFQVAARPGEAESPGVQATTHSARMSSPSSGMTPSRTARSRTVKRSRIWRAFFHVRRNRSVEMLSSSI